MKEIIIELLQIAFGLACSGLIIYLLMKVGNNASDDKDQ
jgi:hypothetical protein